MIAKAAKARPRKLATPAKWRKLFALLPGYDPIATAAPGEWFDVEAAEKVCDFFRECLQFIEGEKAGQPFVLERWQEAIVGCMFGWKRADGTRRYREVLVYVPRKNGKSPWLAGIITYVLLCDGEPGAQLYSAAADREQAALLFRHAAGMIVREPLLARRCKIHRSFKSIEVPASVSIFRALSSEDDTKHGLNIHMAAIDELHAHKSGDLVDVLRTGTGSRRQPITAYITTADFKRDSVCNRTYDHACKVRDGIIKDSAFLPAIWEAPEAADWKSRTTWRIANPNLGVSVKEDYLARECQRAQQQPSYENTFKRLHLNIRTEQDVRWLTLADWDACAALHAPLMADPTPEKLLEYFAGRTCFAALDLSAVKDLTANAYVFPPEDRAGGIWDVLWRFYLPGNDLDRRQDKRIVSDLKAWARAGWLTLTEGDVVDYNRVEADLKSDWTKLDIRQVAVDRWNSTQVQTDLMAEGFAVVQFGQGFASMSAPTKEFEALVIGRRLRHWGNPIARWMASNVAVEEDAAGNLKPAKHKAKGKIDGIVAAIMGLGLAMVADLKVSEPGAALV